MSTVLRLTKPVHDPRTPIPAVGVEGEYRGRNEHGLLVVRFALPFPTSSAGTALLAKDRAPHLDVYLKDDEVEIVSADPDFMLIPDTTKGNVLDHFNATERVLVATWINSHGDKRIGRATADNLNDFPVEYVRDCLRFVAEDTNCSGDQAVVAERLLSVLPPEDPAPPVTPPFG